jgi:hypothetical protein
MTTTREYQPPVVCATWCTDGDGHPEAAFAADQRCWGEWRITPAAFTDGEEGEVAAIAHRGGPETQASVCLNVSIGRIDVDVHLTIDQAQLLVENLTRVIEIVEGTESAP